MKYKIILLLLLISQVSFSQPSLKLIAFSRTTTPGIVPARERNEFSPKQEKPDNGSIGYFIYIQTKKRETIQPLELWVAGKRMLVKGITGVTSPVIVNNDTLIKPTSQKVFALQWEEAESSKPVQAVLNDKIAVNELVLVYKWRGKTKYKCLKKIKALTPVFGE